MVTTQGTPPQSMRGPVEKSPRRSSVGTVAGTFESGSASTHTSRPDSLHSVGAGSLQPTVTADDQATHQTVPSSESTHSSIEKWSRWVVLAILGLASLLIVLLYAIKQDKANVETIETETPILAVQKQTLAVLTEFLQDFNTTIQGLSDTVTRDTLTNKMNKINKRFMEVATVQTTPYFSWKRCLATIKIIAMGSTSWSTWRNTMGLVSYTTAGAMFFLWRLNEAANARQLDTMVEVGLMIFAWLVLRCYFFPSESELANLVAFVISFPVVHQVLKKKWTHAPSFHIRLMYVDVPAWIAVPYITFRYSQHLHQLCGTTFFNDPLVWNTTVWSSVATAAYVLAGKVAGRLPV